MKILHLFSSNKCQSENFSIKAVGVFVSIPREEPFPYFEAFYLSQHLIQTNRWTRTRVQVDRVVTKIVKNRISIASNVANDSLRRWKSIGMTEQRLESKINGRGSWIRKNYLRWRKAEQKDFDCPRQKREKLSRQKWSGELKRQTSRGFTYWFLSILLYVSEKIEDESEENIWYDTTCR